MESTSHSIGQTIHNQNTHDLTSLKQLTPPSAFNQTITRDNIYRERL